MELLFGRRLLASIATVCNDENTAHGSQNDVQHSAHAANNPFVTFSILAIS